MMSTETVPWEDKNRMIASSNDRWICDSRSEVDSWLVIMMVEGSARRERRSKRKTKRKSKSKSKKKRKADLFDSIK